MEIDWDRTGQLLDIVHKVSVVAPGFTNISSAAMTSLRELNEDLRKEAEIKAGRAPTPAAYGDGNVTPTSSQEAIDSGQAVENPTASAPITPPIAPEVHDDVLAHEPGPEEPPYADTPTLADRRI